MNRLGDVLAILIATVATMTVSATITYGLINLSAAVEDPASSGDNLLASLSLVGFFGTIGIAIYGCYLMFSAATRDDTKDLP